MQAFQSSTGIILKSTGSTNNYYEGISLVAKAGKRTPHGDSETESSEEIVSHYLSLQLATGHSDKNNRLAFFDTNMIAESNRIYMQ